MKTQKLRNLRVGDAFEYQENTYIAIALTPDPFDAYCLNTRTRKIEKIDEAERVILINPQRLVWGKSRGKKLNMYLGA